MLTVIGETLVDVVKSNASAPRTHVGGSPMNVAVGLARLGHPVQFVGRYGRDDYGAMITHHLRRNAVLVPLAPDANPTSVATATLDAAGAAHYSFDVLWELPPLDKALPRLLDGTTWLHTGSLAAMLEPGAHTVQAAVERAHPRSLISYDPNCRPTLITDREFARRQAEKFVRLADVVRASDEDLRWLYPERPVEETAHAWLAMGPAIVVATHGAGGPWAVARSGTTELDAPQVDVVDTVGAGDSFTAALIGTLVDRGLAGSGWRGRLQDIGLAQLQEILGYATRAAAVTVSRAGANPPSREELGA
ncbi:carbohydrate kinase family protein [Arthrobacter mobilis]|uniref:Carbohydrate kinase n=1 Tax=Arthrobacter mobilis TaxID=2724944 RepID=A0A7X6HEY6_9MICC|nr:carbohydrate kinase [Arthrobacter mobilis]NKX55140.1 carbohydrate kinase [Arthrobacter mobilis]